MAVNLNAPEISVVDKVAIVKVPVVPVHAPVENIEEEDNQEEEEEENDDDEEEEEDMDEVRMKCKKSTKISICCFNFRRSNNKNLVSCLCIE